MLFLSGDLEAGRLLLLYKKLAAIRLGIVKRLGICALEEHVSDTFEMLTSREQEVFLGRTNKEIGERLGISVCTVRSTSRPILARPASWMVR